MFGNHYYGQPQRFQPMEQLGQQFNNQYMQTMQQMTIQSFSYNAQSYSKYIYHALVSAKF